MKRIFDRYETCYRLLPDARATLMQFEGVVGVGIGPRQQKGRLYPEQICLIIYVDEKKPAAELEANQFIPKEYVTIRTDVVEVGSRQVDLHNEFDRRWLNETTAAAVS